MVWGHVHVAMVMQGIGGKNYLPGNGCDEYVGWSSFVQVRGFTKWCRWDTINWQVSTYSVNWQLSSTVLLWGLLSQNQSKGVEWLHQCRGTECFVCCLLDSGCPYSSEAVIRRWFVVSCILLYWVFLLVSLS